MQIMYNNVHTNSKYISKFSVVTMLVICYNSWGQSVFKGQASTYYFYLFREEPLSLRFCDYASNNVGLLGHPTISHLQIDCCIVEEFSER